MSMIRYEPVSLFTQLNGEINRLFQNSRMQTAAVPEHDWIPAVDIHEEAERYVLVADIPGVNRQDMEITLKEGVLTVKGERQAQGEKRREDYRHRERVHGSFMRQFTLPDTVDSDNISATVRDGVLEVTIPKQAQPEPRKITVN